MTTIRTLLSGIVDYAGLFPPAALDMSQTVENYARYRGDEHAWMLGRLIVPAARLDELADALRQARPSSQEAWRVSALAGPQIEVDLDRIATFNGDAPSAVVDSIELKATEVTTIEQAAEVIPQELTTYVEVPIASDPTELVKAIGASGLRAKVRTGGVTEEMFPTPADVLRFMYACIESGVPFKATAGLHHALRSDYRLTYEPDSGKATMYGFLNVFLTAAFVDEGIGQDDVVGLLLEDSAEAIRFEERSISWQAHRVDVAHIDAIRHRLAISFGSCSFEEPVEELKGLHLI